jgi:hypothetical protein
MSTPLEDERKALLERMRASRRYYRSVFIPADEPPALDSDRTQAFPRSHTFKFLTQHPYSTSLGLLVALSIMPHGRLNRAVKGGLALTAGILGSGARAMMMRQVLPSIIRSFGSRKRRS